MWSPTDVVVTVKQGRDLLVKGKSGTNDAYATIELGKEKFATSSVKSNSPRWFTECSFSLPQGGVFTNKVVVCVSVYHKRHSKLGLESDELIGQTHIPLSALNCCDNKDRARWYSLVGKKKDSKKERGEVEISFKFQSNNRPPVLCDKKESPKPLRILTSGLRGKFRRRSEDEDSGVGDTERFSPLGLGKGRSLENLTPSFLSDSQNQSFERSFRTNSATSSTSSSPGALVSARGSARSLKTHSLGSQKAVSVDVLHRPPLPKTATNLSRSNSGSSSGGDGGGSGTKKPDGVKGGAKQHARNRSMPNFQLKQIMGQLRKTEQAPQSELCVNGGHFYLPGTQDSGASSTASSPGMSLRSSSLTNVNQGLESTAASTATNLNMNSSNSVKRHSMVDFGELKRKHKQQASALPTLYKPKNYYRLDVRELPKVSTIHEDSTAALHTMTHEQLVKLASAQNAQLAQKNVQIREMEDYIDSLLVRVMICTPQILDKKFEDRRLRK